MSFDNETVGKLQGEALVEAMGGEGTILMLNGAPSDPNAAQFKAGAHSVLDGSGLTILEEYDNPDWSPENAQQLTTDQLEQVRPVGDPGRLRRQRRPGRRRRRGPHRCGCRARRAAADHRPGRRARRDPADPRGRAGDDDLQADPDRGRDRRRGRGRSSPTARSSAAPRDTGIDQTEYEGVASFIFDPIVVTADNVDDTVIADGFYTRRRHLHRRLRRRLRGGRHQLMTHVDAAAPARGEVVLSLAGVNKRFGAVQALTDVHLDVAAGEVVALVGDNGAGKSTLVKMISGVYQPDAGEIVFDGKQVTVPRPVRGPGSSASPRSSRTWRSATTSTWSPTCSSGRSGTSGRSSTRSRWRRRRGGCCAPCRPRSRRSGSRSPSLSGGQRQTVAIARSLVGEPKVVMLDEPTAALGVAQTAEVLNLIERLRETGLGVILVSHNMADVQAVADRIVVLRLGRNAAEFRVEEATTAQLVAAITGASDNVVAARAARHGRSHEPTGTAPDGADGSRTPTPRRPRPPRSPPTSPTSGSSSQQGPRPATLHADLEPAQGRRPRQRCR